MNRPRFFVRYVHLEAGTFAEAYLTKRLLPFLFKGEKDGTLQVLYFKQVGGKRHEIPKRNKKAQKENGNEKRAAHQ